MGVALTDGEGASPWAPWSRILHPELDILHTDPICASLHKHTDKHNDTQCPGNDLSSGQYCIQYQSHTWKARLQEDQYENNMFFFQGTFPCGSVCLPIMPRSPCLDPTNILPKQKSAKPPTTQWKARLQNHIFAWLCFLEDLFVCLCVLVFLLCADPCLPGPTIILPKQQSARPRTTNPVCIIVFQDLATILLSLKTGGGDRVDSQLPSLISLFIFV